MFYCELESNEFLFNQGDTANTYFILAEGSINLIINNVVKKVLKPGDGFGELALIFNAERSASVQANENCSFWAIERKSFRQIVQDMTNKKMKENRKFMEKVKFFRKSIENLNNHVFFYILIRKFN